MLSAFKRLTGKNDGATSNSQGGARPPSHQSMSSSLQRKFAKGVQYNMKIIIKGDRNVGKSCLFYRLQGLKFFEEYIPTEEIQVTSIQWSYKATDDVVKVEVWDVVDRGKKKKRFEGLKFDNSQLEMPEEPALDAEFLDVYKSTNGVIMMMDLTKSWTFDYVQRELPKIPENIPVIVLANHCDMAHHRTVTSDHVTFFLEGFSSQRSAEVRYAESSMRNGFGLKLLHKFFNLPFLQLQKETLLKQLERNEQETALTVQELDMYFTSDEANYNKFLETLVKKRREVADSNANIPTTAITTSVSQNQVSSTPAVSGVSEVKRSQSGPIFIGAGKPIPVPNNAIIRNNVLGGKNTNNATANSFSKLSVKENFEVKPTVTDTSIASLEEFCPDGGQLDRSFLEDVSNSSQQVTQEAMDSDSDDDTGNPLVSEFQDDLDPEEFLSSSKPNVAAAQMPDGQPSVVNINKHMSSSNDELDVEKNNVLANDEYDSTLNSEISEITSEAFDNWLSTNSKWRRSPEGGEDVSAMCQTLDYSGSTVNDDNTSVTSSNIHAELLGSSKKGQSSSDSEHGLSCNIPLDKEKRKHDKDRSEKKQKQKKSKEKERDKEKDKDSSTKSEKKHSKRRHSRNEPSGSRRKEKSRDELEEFLNGVGNASIDDSYEAI